MKKKVYREMYREIYGIDVQKEREIMDNLWAKKLKAAAKADDEVKHGKKVKIERVGKTDINKKVGK